MSAPRARQIVLAAAPGYSNAKIARRREVHVDTGTHEELTTKTT